MVVVLVYSLYLTREQGSKAATHQARSVVARFHSKSTYLIFNPVRLLRPSVST